MLQFNDDVRLAFMAIVISALPLLAAFGIADWTPEQVGGVTTLINNILLFGMRIVPSKNKVEADAALKAANEKVRELELDNVRLSTQRPARVASRPVTENGGA